MEITVNGEKRQVAANLTVRDLLETLELGDRPIAVERNGEVIPRAEHSSATLADGDRLELVGFVGGG